MVKYLEFLLKVYSTITGNVVCSCYDKIASYLYNMLYK